MFSIIFSVADLYLYKFLSQLYEAAISFDFIVPKVISGMRGMTGLLWEGSLLDPDEVYISIYLFICYT